MYSDSDLLKVAELHYIEKNSQSNIAKLLNVSVATVSRMLGEALNRGMISVKITARQSRVHTLERLLETNLKLKKAVVLDTNSNDLYKLLGKEAADILPEFCHGEKMLGIGCGRTILETALSLDSSLNFPNLSVVPLMGGWGVEEIERDVNRIAAVIGQKWNCKFQFLLMPALLSSPQVLNKFFAEPQIKLTTKCWELVNVAMFSVGPEIKAANYAYLPPELLNISELNKKKCVCDILGRIIDSLGNEADITFNKCLSSIPMEKLKHIPVRIGIGGGKNKINGLRAAISSGVLNVLITDRGTADYLIGGKK